MIFRRLSAVACLSAMAAFGFTQSSFVSPHLMELPDGTFLGIAWDLRGGQPKSTTVVEGPPVIITLNPIGMLLSPYGNGGFMQLLAKNMIGGQVNASWITNTCAIRSSNVTTGVSYSGVTPLEVTFPACDVDSKDPGGIVVVANAETAKGIPVPDEVKRRLAQHTAKKQKMWLPSNFRLRIGDLPCSRVNKIEALVVKQTIADLDGDGALDYFFMPDDLSFTVPMPDARPFQEAFLATCNGKPTEYPVALEYLDDLGNPLITLTWQTVIYSAGPADAFNPDDQDGSFAVRSKGRTYHKVQVKVVDG
jgi:hypothetical protein